MMRRTRTSGPLKRISLVVLYGSVAFFIADRAGSSRPAAPAAAEPMIESDTTPVTDLSIRLYASRAIETWRISIDGVDLVPDRVNEWEWTIRHPSVSPHGQRLVIDLSPLETGIEAPLAVRLEYSDSSRHLTRSLWGTDDLIESVDLTRLPADNDLP